MIGSSVLDPWLKSAFSPAKAKEPEQWERKSFVRFSLASTMGRLINSHPKRIKSMDG